MTTLLARQLAVLIGLTAMGAAFGSGASATGGRRLDESNRLSRTLVLENCLVTPANEALVPALVSGQLAELPVKLGDEVEANAQLGLIDDRRARFAYDVAAARHAGSQEQAASTVNVEYRIASAKVAENAHRRAMEANAGRSEVVPQLDMERLELEKDAANLAKQQAELEKVIAAFTRDAALAEMDAAEHEIARHQLHAPFAGVIIELPKERGEFVDVGEPVAQIIRMDELHISAYADATVASSSSLRRRPITATIMLEAGGQTQVRGEITFCSPVIESNNTFRVQAKIVNVRDGEGWVIKPGMEAVMTVELDGETR